MSRIFSAEKVMGNVFLRPNYLEKTGDKVEGHTHNFDHVTFLVRGQIHARVTTPSGKVFEKEFTAPAYMLIKVENEHEFIALQDDTEFVCIYAHRTPQGEVTEEYNGWEGAYE